MRNATATRPVVRVRFGTQVGEWVVKALGPECFTVGGDLVAPGHAETVRVDRLAADAPLLAIVASPAIGSGEPLLPR